MNIGFYIWIGACWLVTATWLMRHVHLSRALREGASVSSTMDFGECVDLPNVSVLVAAKDEEDSIAECVRTLCTQDYPHFDVTVVNDRSVDGTAEMLDMLRSKFPNRLRVLSVDNLPDGWFGKSHALSIGVREVRGEYLLLTDADCRQTSSRSILAAVRYAQTHDVEMLSVMPRVQPSGWPEAILLPVCTAILMLWHQPEKVNDPNRPEAYANGAFILIRRDAYERIGGHHRVRDALCEDMELARIAKAEGVRLRAVQNVDLYETRMYGALRPTWRGWCRIFQGSLANPRRIIRAMLVVIVSTLMPSVSFVLSIVVLTIANSSASSMSPVSPVWEHVALASGAAVVALHSVMMRFYMMMGTSPWRSLTYVLGAAVSVGILGHALAKRLGFGSTTWRGTTYDHGRSSSDTAHAS
jgi:chlorobactene glucosyltransferase